MTRKTDLPAVPDALADVAMVDGAGIAAAAALSMSTWHDLVRKGEAPQPAIRGPRFTRWRLSDIRQWLIQRAERGSDTPAARTLVVNATRASRLAQAKRSAAAAQVRG